MVSNTSVEEGQVIPNGGLAENIPAVLREKNQWVVWRREPGKDDKPTKVLYQPETGRKASTIDPSTWFGFGYVLDRARKRSWDGVGFIHLPEDNLVGIDWDKCRDPDTGVIDPDVMNEITELDTYAEVSPSGTGVRAYAFGKKPGTRCMNRRDRFEMYDGTTADGKPGGRFLTVTGNKLRGLPTTINHRQDEINALYHAHFKDKEPNKETGDATPPPPLDKSDEELLDVAFKASNGAAIKRLWDGDRSGYGSDSEADLALCSHLRFYFHSRENVDRMFRQSGLYRKKWERSTYREPTLDKAFEGQTEFYDPSSRGPIPEIIFPEPGSTATSPRSVTLDPYKAFPVEALPPRLRDLAVRGAEAIGCDPAFIAGPGLAALASAIGGTRVAQVQGTWTEPSILWTAIVGESSSRKSPAYDLATTPLWDLQIEYFRDHDRAVREYKKEDTTDDPPVRKRVIVDDITIEAVAPILADNPRGVLVAAEELDQFFQGLCRYSQGKATDRPRWLRLYGGRPLAVDRTIRGSVYVPRAVASITGTIQPDVLVAAMTAEARASGLAARWLVAMPPRVKRRWSNATVPDVVVDQYRIGFEPLLELAYDQDDDGNPRPRRIPLSPVALRMFGEFVDRLGEQADAALDADTRAVLGKAEGVAVRLALVHELAAAESDAGQVTDVGELAMAAGIMLAEWYAAEADRVCGIAATPAADRTARSLVEVVTRRGGSVTAREIWKNNKRRYATADHAEAALDGLVKAGLGTWEDVPPGPKGGRPTRRFRLTPEPTH